MYWFLFVIYLGGVNQMAEEIIYKRINECDLRAIYHPVEEANKPLLLYIHGGGLIWGSPSDLLRSQIKIYNEAGYNVLSIAYRLAPETKIPEIVEDVQDAFTWVLEEGIKNYSYNSEKVAVIGCSAGGYLALMTGTFNIKPQAIISFYGYGDIIGDWYQEPSEHFNSFPSIKKPLVERLIKEEEISEATLFIRYPIYLYMRQQGEWLKYTTDFESHTHIEELKSYSPLYLVDESYPPTLLLHGNEDEEVPYDQSLQMQAILNEKNVKNDFVIIEGGKHSFDKLMFRTEVKEAFQKVIIFLNEVL